ncbi:MAG: helix-turn-helix transcriptional regulator [Flammeovirgaceae bacterium]|nr:MAG: helix-turn-helix transcriptional regulator [Flammeovirgaceae bacterium]
MATSTNVYYPVNKIEKSILNCIWQVSETAGAHRKEIILPKGTVEIIFNFSEGIYYSNSLQQVKKKLPVAFVNGINFKPVELIKNGEQHFLGIQLNSIGLRLLFRMPAETLNDEVYDARHVCPGLADLATELSLIKTFHHRVEIILKWMYRQLPECWRQQEVGRAEKLKCLMHGTDLSAKKLSEAICLSDRHLRRFSREWLGMNTEQFIHYHKYLLSLNLLHSTIQSLTEIGHLAGYYDQSHFIREFRAYTNLTPGQYRQAASDLPGHIFL